MPTEAFATTAWAKSSKNKPHFLVSALAWMNIYLWKITQIKAQDPNTDLSKKMRKEKRNSATIGKWEQTFVKGNKAFFFQSPLILLFQLLLPRVRQPSMYLFSLLFVSR